MNCPRCGKPIGGYVEANSIGARRVAEGKCPHCGRSMPSGYKVSFKSSGVPRPSRSERYSGKTVEEENRHNPYRIFCLCLDGALTILFGILNGMWLWGLIIGIALILSAVIYYGVSSYFITDPFNGTTRTKPRSGVLVIVGLAVGIVSSFLFSAKFFQDGAGNLSGQWYWIIIGFGLSALVMIFRWRSVSRDNAARNRCGIDDSVINTLKNSRRSGNMTCGLCGEKIWEDRSFAASVSHGGAAVICEDCIIKAKDQFRGSCLEIAGRSFYIII